MRQRLRLKTNELIVFSVGLDLTLYCRRGNATNPNYKNPPATRTLLNTVNNLDESANQKWVMGSMSSEMDGAFILYLFYIIETLI